MAITTEPEVSASEGQYTPPRQPSASSLAEAALGSSRVAFEDLKTSIARGEQARRDASGAVAIARDAQREALETKAAVVNPELRRARLAGESFTEAVAATPRPIAPTLPPAPSRGLRAFLTPTEGEAPEASIQKLIAGLGLFATMVGGGSRRNAIGALAAFQGAMKGWQEGDKERADRAFADWKVKTETTLAAHDRQVSEWDAWFKSSNLSVDQMLRGATISALEQDNVVAARAFSAGSLEKALDHVEKTTQAADTIRAKMADILASRELSKAQMEQLAEYRREALRQQAELRAAELRSREAIAAASDATRREIAEGRRADKEAALAAGAKTPNEQLKKLEDTAMARSYLAEMRRLAPRVRMDKIIGGINPWLVQVDATGKIGPIPLPKGLLQSLTDDERRLLALTEDYADKILRDRTGAAVTDSEFVRMLRFLMSGAVTPQAFSARLKLQEDIAVATEGTIRDALEQAGIKAPRITPKSIGGKLMRIRQVGGGQELEGPEGPIPQGYERVGG